ncbi:hypothetical protein NC653_041379 [Populus alba x Populus x berolinensis]|uniref:Uncharacterized protein n=1 Tax=Populus alba x Populus x berolinensis TaxID=444605 RepID=A0AAD6PQP0_9ROSI|nr:hypothetical protein NC653_041379 [Populus alba x Populus x berolinensis]
MSISTTKKFIVKGKSVDFINREGSSLSIPKKGPARLPNCLSYSLFLLTVQNSLSFSFIRFFHKCIWAAFFFLLFTSLVIDRIDIQTNFFE